MVKSLVVVESPAKAKTIQKILGNGFAPTYVVIKERKKVLGEIVEAARASKAVYLAPDPDREGEAIAWHIADAIQADNGKKKKGKVKGKVKVKAKAEPKRSEEHTSQLQSRLQLPT